LITSWQPEHSNGLAAPIRFFGPAQATGNQAVSAIAAILFPG
jgi:hypothetical protein